MEGIESTQRDGLRRVGSEQLPLRSDGVINAGHHLVLVVRLHRRGGVVADAREASARPIRQRPKTLVRRELLPDWIEHVLRNHVTRERIANGRPGRSVVDRKWIRNDYLLSGRIERLRKIALQLGGGRDRRRNGLRQTLPEAFEVHEEERLVLAFVYLG